MIVAEFIGGGPLDGHTLLLERAVTTWYAPVPADQSISAYLAAGGALVPPALPAVYRRAEHLEGHDQNGQRIYRYTYEEAK